jgi:hypothetical protein
MKRERGTLVPKQLNDVEALNNLTKKKQAHYA